MTTTTIDLTAIGTLPAELLHGIFFYLTAPDIFAGRLVCSTFAAIGIDHGFQDISICFKRQYFQRLLDIAQHPKTSKRIRSVHYHARRFSELRSFEYWSCLPRCTVLRNSKYRSLSMVPSKPKLRAAYVRYRTVHRDQVSIFDPNFDTPTIDLSLEGFTGKGSILPHISFPETLFDPICDTTRGYRNQGSTTCCDVQPVYALAEAVAQPERPLR